MLLLSVSQRLHSAIQPPQSQINFSRQGKNRNEERSLKGPDGTSWKQRTWISILKRWPKQMEKGWKNILEFKRKTTIRSKKLRTWRSPVGKDNRFGPWCQQKQNLPSEADSKQSSCDSLPWRRRADSQEESAKKARLMMICILCTFFHLFPYKNAH